MKVILCEILVRIQGIREVSIILVMIYVGWDFATKEQTKMVLGLDHVLFEEEVMDLWQCQQRRRHLAIEQRSKWLWKPPLLMKPKEI